MPIENLPLFRAEVVRSHLGGFTLPAAAADARGVLARWVTLLESTHGRQLNERELLPDFLTDVFSHVLGYRGPAARDAAGRYTFSRETHVEVDGKFADAVLGELGAESPRYTAALEGKGPRDPLDRPFAGRTRSAVEQAYGYAINLPCDWILVTNLREIRLYYKGSTQRTFERFPIPELAADEQAYTRFVFLLGADRVVPPGGRSHLYELLEESARAGEALTQDYYQDYARLRRTLLEALLAANPNVPRPSVLTATQRLLDRVLFIAFAEDRELLPGATLQRAYEHRDPYRPRPIWDNFRALFRAIDQGSQPLNVPRYNGGLFALDPLLDEQLEVPDAACEHLRRLGDYHYAKPRTEGAGRAGDAPIIDVDILGHIFEQSIEDLEGLRAQLDGTDDTQRGPSRRRREGAFYTPKAITSFIVDRALRPTLSLRFDALRLEHYDRARATRTTQPAVLVNPMAYDRQTLNEPQRQALIAFWTAWLERLTTVRVLDPACGSGAFLVEAFDQLQDRYEDAIEHLVELTNQPSLFDPDRSILQHNLFGVDLNEEAVEICRLSIWIKTAKRGKVLADLNENIRVGNSIVSDPAVDPRALDWRSAFPEVQAQGGFDVVVGNPPYVRAELLTGIKPHLEARYASYHGGADLYVYFYELGLRLLRPGGRLAYIVTNKWMLAVYGEPLRRLFSTQGNVEEIVNLGHAKQIFPDADVFPSILLVQRPGPGAHDGEVRVATIPRDSLDLMQLPAQVAAHVYPVARERLGAGPWVLEAPGVEALFARVRAAGIPLQEYLGQPPTYGIKTGYNEAFLLDRVERDTLLQAQPALDAVLRPYLRGQDIRRWHPEWAGLYMIVLRSSADYDWPWSAAGSEAEAESIFARTYPGLHAHMKQHEARLRQRSDQGRYWWELRPCDYYDRFGAPKLVYKDLSYYSEFAYDVAGTFTNDLCFILPSSDLWLLAVLNSPIAWAYLWRHAVHGKDEVLRLKTHTMAALPIPRASADTRARAEALVTRCITLTQSQAALIQQLHDWLRVEFGVEKAGEALGDPAALSADAFIAEVRKRRPRGARLSAADVQHLRAEYERAVPQLHTAGVEQAQLEAELAQLVEQAYGLTPADVAVMWASAPPRMPGVAPAAAQSA